MLAGILAKLKGYKTYIGAAAGAMSGVALLLNGDIAGGLTLLAGAAQAAGLRHALDN